MSCSINLSIVDYYELMAQLERDLDKEPTPYLKYLIPTIKENVKFRNENVGEEEKPALLQ